MTQPASSVTAGEMRDRLPRVMVLLAGLWCALLLVVGTLVLRPEDGLFVAVPCGIPLGLVLAFYAAVWIRGHRGRRGPGPVAWTVVGLCGAFAVAGMLSIGMLVVPVLLALLVAAGRLQGAGTLGI